MFLGDERPDVEMIRGVDTLNRKIVEQGPGVYAQIKLMAQFSGCGLLNVTYETD